LLRAQEGEEGGGPARQSELERACDLLREFLASGSLLAVEGEKLARAADISQASLMRARKTLGIEPHRHGPEGAQHWYWLLPVFSHRAEESDQESA
jgi:hypothetical protein